MDAVILVGGKGTRLATVVNDLPKPLAPVHGRPFLDYVLDYLLASGQVSRFILATGHLADKVEAHYGARYRGIDIAYSREHTPLGTGGALLNAMRRMALTAPFLLLNGDSFVDADLLELHRLHRASSAGLTLALFAVDNAARFGTVCVTKTLVTAFVEKNGLAQAGFINSGIYLIEPRVLQAWRGQLGPLSLETVIMPQLVAGKQVHGMIGGSRFIDIGLPETYQAALDFFPDTA